MTTPTPLPSEESKESIQQYALSLKQQYGLEFVGDDVLIEFANHFFEIGYGQCAQQFRTCIETMPPKTRGE